MPEPRILNVVDLEGTTTSRSFVGESDGDGVPVSFSLVDASLGQGPGLHRHDYAEVFIVQEGTATFTIDDRSQTVRAGQIVVVPAGTAHAFRNIGPGQLRQIDIHLSPRFVTEWLGG